MPSAPALASSRRRRSATSLPELSQQRRRRCPRRVLPLIVPPALMPRRGDGHLLRRARCGHRGRGAGSLPPRPSGPNIPKQSRFTASADAPSLGISTPSSPHGLERPRVHWAVSSQEPRAERAFCLFPSCSTRAACSPCAPYCAPSPEASASRPPPSSCPSPRGPSTSTARSTGTSPTGSWRRAPGNSAQLYSRSRARPWRSASWARMVPMFALAMGVRPPGSAPRRAPPPETRPAPRHRKPETAPAAQPDRCPSRHSPPPKPAPDPSREHGSVSDNLQHLSNKVWGT